MCVLSRSPAPQQPAILCSFRTTRVSSLRARRVRHRARFCVPSAAALYTAVEIKTGPKRRTSKMKIVYLPGGARETHHTTLLCEIVFVFFFRTNNSSVIIGESSLFFFFAIISDYLYHVCPFVCVCECTCTCSMIPSIASSVSRINFMQSSCIASICNIIREHNYYYVWKSKNTFM